jgi:hypothetical protein
MRWLIWIFIMFVSLLVANKLRGEDGTIPPYLPKDSTKLVCHGIFNEKGELVDVECIKTKVADTEKKEPIRKGE